MVKGYGLTSSADIIRTGAIDLEGDSKPEVILDDKEKLDWLKAYSKDFSSAAKDARGSGNLSGLKSLGVSSSDAREYVKNSKTNPDVEFERLASKYFTKQLWGKNENTEQSLGAYNEKTISDIDKMQDLGREYYDASGKFVLNPTKETFDGRLEAANKYVEGHRANDREPPVEQPAQKLSSYGPGKESPICRHYAPTMSVMMHEAGVPNHVVTCNITTGQSYGIMSRHATVISDKTGNVIEPTTVNPDNAYMITMGNRSDKGVNIDHPVQALKNGGEVVIAPVSQDDSRVAVYSTRADAGIDALESAKSRYVISETSKALDKGGWNAAFKAADKSFEKLQSEDKSPSKIDEPELRKFIEKDIDRSTAFDKLKGMFNSKERAEAERPSVDAGQQQAQEQSAAR